MIISNGKPEWNLVKAYMFLHEKTGRRVYDNRWQIAKDFADSQPPGLGHR